MDDHWNTKRWDVCSNYLLWSSKISCCKIHHVGVGSVELKGGPHTALRPWGSGRLTPPQKNNHPYRLQDYCGVRGDLRGKYLRRAHSFRNTHKNVSYVLQNHSFKSSDSLWEIRNICSNFGTQRSINFSGLKFSLRGHTVSHFNPVYSFSSYTHKNNF